MRKDINDKAEDTFIKKNPVDLASLFNELDKETNDFEKDIQEQADMETEDK